MKVKNLSRFLVTMLLAGLLIAACTGGEQQVDLGQEGETAPQQQVDEGAPAGEVEVSEGEVAPTSPPESADADVKPTPRSELSATDPSTVSLASGRLQLVWFFAFW